MPTDNQQATTTMATTSARTGWWTRDSSVLLGLLLVVMLLVVYFWWPLAAALIRRFSWSGQWWLRLDWLLIGIFAFMTAVIVSRANLKRDALLIFVGTCGGLVIEAWGTQTNLWHYYTFERPPLWIIPAWPIANLAIDRIARAMDHLIKKHYKDRADEKIVEKAFKVIYWGIFIFFMTLMVTFIAPTMDKSFTVFSLILCSAIMFTPTNYRYVALTFIAGTGLGYFLELWGTTRHCWIYYTLETPPVFAVFAHGMAAVAFWRAAHLLTNSYQHIKQTYKKFHAQKN